MQKPRRHVLFFGLFLGLWSAACGLVRAQPAPAQAAEAFLTWHAERAPSGAPSAQELVELQGLVTKELVCLLATAGKFRDRFAQLAPNDKPPFVEGDLFLSAAYERAAKFEIELVREHVQTATVLAHFYDGDGGDWRDRLHFRREDGRWRLADTDRIGRFAFGNAGSLLRGLYEAMGSDIPAARWQGRTARRCGNAQ